ncbi:hypothetical protein O3P69_005102 [Scylla paramamosain]|uniref:Uncharacterized protein n=1 Tax=Scylla paramamosain TaxID=85552 RepID=A0AAW0UCF0_SCYPA
MQHINILPSALSSPVSASPGQVSGERGRTHAVTWTNLLQVSGVTDGGLRVIEVNLQLRDRISSLSSIMGRGEAGRGGAGRGEAHQARRKE